MGASLRARASRARDLHLQLNLLHLLRCALFQVPLATVAYLSARSFGTIVSPTQHSTSAHSRTSLLPKHEQQLQQHSLFSMDCPNSGGHNGGTPVGSPIDLEMIALVQQMYPPYNSNRRDEAAPEDQMYGCNVDRTWPSFKTRRSRSQRLHNDRPTVFCEICGLTFASRGNLNRHRRVAHQGLRVYCTYTNCYQVRCMHVCVLPLCFFFLVTIYTNYVSDVERCRVSANGQI